LSVLVEAARREGALDLVWGDSVLGGREGVSRLAEGFNRHYGLNLEVRFTPGPSFPEAAARLAQEYQANRRAFTDVYIGADRHMNWLMAQGVLEAVDWSAWAPHIRDAALVGPNGMAVTFQSWVPGIVYNSQRITGDLVPRTLQDLLKPQYRGRIASTPYASGFDRLAAPEVWGKNTHNRVCSALL
jgi:ABC-type Fe3+ transport system substrate-binding protein